MGDAGADAPSSVVEDLAGDLGWLRCFTGRLGQPPSLPAAEGAGGPGMAVRADRRRLDWAGLYWAGLDSSGSPTVGQRPLFTQIFP